MIIDISAFLSFINYATELDCYKLRQKKKLAEKEKTRKDALEWVKIKMQEEKILKGEFEHGE